MGVYRVVMVVIVRVAVVMIVVVMMVMPLTDKTAHARAECIAQCAILDV